jgi:hypothetical protein
MEVESGLEIEIYFYRRPDTERCASDWVGNQPTLWWPVCPIG